MPNKPLRERQLPRAHKIARCMAALGYEPRPLQDPNFVEYTKDYAEPGGRIGRCSVFFTRESWISDMDSAKLGKFRVTVQGQIDPVAELVNEQAPPPMRGDMLHMLEVLEGEYLPGSEPEEDVECTKCGMMLAEFVSHDDGSVTCLRPELCELERSGHAGSTSDGGAGRSHASSSGTERSGSHRSGDERSEQDLSGTEGT
jgi:hypothetical protein